MYLICTTWIEAFLTRRTQRVEVYDATSKTIYSDEIPVIIGAHRVQSWDPHCSHIYSRLYNSPENPLTLYADDFRFLGQV